MQMLSFLKFYTAYVESKLDDGLPESCKPTVAQPSVLSDARVDSSLGSTSDAADRKIVLSA
jgi:hypothetical protein